MIEHTTEKNQSNKEKLVRDLKIVIEDAEALLRETADAAGEKVSNARVKTKESIAAAKVHLVNIQETTTQKTKEAAQKGENYIKENPWKSAGIAAGVGALVGLLINRKK
jgi:ElaB/YqjD/DUF883 family membrane-anchored ribosome-binding protein